MQPHNLQSQKQVLHIRNMVSNSCIKLVKSSLEQTGFIQVLHIELGLAEIAFDKQVLGTNEINAILKNHGFELIANRDLQLVEQIKTTLIQHIFYGSNTSSLIRNSDFLSQRLNQPYPFLSKLFSERTGTTLEKYIILLKIERIKELISYNEMTLSEIAYLMGYSSVQYLSNQFKQITGVSVTDYKNSMRRDRKPLASIID